MSERDKGNPRSFRNGDIIRITNTGTDVVFVKFGENYYNLSEGGQMKGYKYLPRGKKEVLFNLSGMGEFFKMDEYQLKRLIAGEDVPFDGPAEAEPETGIDVRRMEEIVKKIEAERVPSEKRWTTISPEVWDRWTITTGDEKY